jgi:glycosyltransferase involved in cell wall biosynthesis
MKHLPPDIAEQCDRWADESLRGAGMTPARGQGRRRIAMLGWAWVPLQEREGTGYNLVVSELAAGLVREGHRVYYLRSGMTYSVRAGAHVELRDMWRGVGCFDLCNAPNVATADRNFRNVLPQIASPAHTAMVLDWVRAVRADVVHVHSMEGFGFDLIPALRAAHIPVVVTPHNYYYLCPQVDLMRGERETCVDYDGGRRCEGCIPAPEPGEERRRRRWEQSADRVLGPGFYRHALAARATLAGRLHLGHGPARVASPASPGVGVFEPGPAEPLFSAGGHLKVLNKYGERREAGVGALNAAGLVLCPGRFLMRVHEAMGVEPARLRHVPLGLPHVDAIAASAAESPFADRTPWSPVGATRPLRLGYFGSTKPNKGLAVLVRAMEAMPASVRERCVVVVHAAGEDGAFRAALAGRPDVEFAGPYRTDQLPAALRGVEVGLFPNLGMENCPLVLLEMLAAGKFVVASALGAPTDWVRPGRTGVLVPPGDAEALAGAITDLVEGRTVIPSVNEVRRASPVPTFREFLGGVLRAYEVAAATP